jgi:hypothetical protein
VSQQASPRGTFQKIADVLKAEIEADPQMVDAVRTDIAKQVDGLIWKPGELSER